MKQSLLLLKAYMADKTTFDFIKINSLILSTSLSFDSLVSFYHEIFFCQESCNKTMIKIDWRK